LLLTLNACQHSVTLTPVPCRPNSDCVETPRTSNRIASIPSRGILDTRTFVTFTHLDARASKIEVLANGRPFLILKQGEVARAPLWPSMYRGQTVETVFLARGYDESGRLIGTDTRRVHVWGGDRQGREEVWEIRRLRPIR
jgi:hypothetical protein